MHERLFTENDHKLMNAPATFFSRQRSIKDIEKEIEEIEYQITSISKFHEKLIDLLINIRDNLDPHIFHQLDFEKLNTIENEERKKTISICCGLLCCATALFTGVSAATFALMAKYNFWLFPTMTEGAKAGAALGFKIGVSTGLIADASYLTIQCCCKSNKCCCKSKEHTLQLNRVENSISRSIINYRVSHLAGRVEAIATLQTLITQPLENAEIRIAQLIMQEQQLKAHLELAKIDEKERDLEQNNVTQMIVL